MAAPRLRASLSTVVLLTALAVALSAPPVGAVSTIPGRHAGHVLEGEALSAVVGDVDGDGVRELVRLVPRPEDDLHLAVDVVRMTGDRPERLDPAPLRRSYGVEEVLEGQAVPDEDDKVAARVDEPARLAVWRGPDGEEVLAMAIGRQAPRPCCLTVWRVGIGPDGVTSLTLAADPILSAEHVRVLDMDGDGIEELVVLEPPTAQFALRLPIDVLRWTGDRFEVIEGTVGPVGQLSLALVPLGDSDGLPGEEVGVVVRLPTAGTPAMLHRIGMDASGALRVDSAPLPGEGNFAPVRAPDGPRLLFSIPPLGVRLMSWPAGGDLETAVDSTRRGTLVTTLGSGANASVFLLRQGSLDVLDGALNPRQGFTVAPIAASWPGPGQPPYVGVLPGGLAGEEEVLIFAGRAILPRSEPRNRRLLEIPMATLPGVTPVGTFGAEQGWMALAVGPFDARRVGGQLVEPSGGPRGTSISVAPVSEVLTVEEDRGSLEPRLGRAEPMGSGPRPIVLTNGRFELNVDGPPGTRVRVLVGDEAVGPDVVIGPDRSGVVPVTIPGPDAEDGGRLALVVQAVTPSGHGYGGRWTVEVDLEPPPLTVAQQLARLSFEAQLTGHSEPFAAVTVDGEPVFVDRNGRFSIDVPAGPLPRSVAVRVTDAAGNVTERAVSVVAPVDYRQLPWLPIVAALTVLAGAVLYVWSPRGRPAPIGRAAVEEGTFEEIE